MKRIVLLAFITIPAFFALLKPGFYESHDGINNSARLAAFYTSLTDGQIVPRWAANLNFGFGHPVLIFQYPLPNYLGSLFHIVGLSFTDSIKLSLILATIFSAIFFYLWLSKLTNKNAAFLGAVLYTYAPYKFLDIYVRNSWGEIIGLTVLPLTLYLLEKMIKEEKLAKPLLSISVCLLILSHNVIALISLPVIILYLSIRSYTEQKPFMFLAKSLLPVFWGLSLSAFFWLPALLEAKYTTRNLLIGDMYQKHFLDFKQLIFSPWGYGTSVEGPNDGMSFMLGFMQWAFVLVSLFVLFLFRMEKRSKALLLFMIALFATSIFLTLPPSAFILNIFPLIAQFQFPWRFLSLSVFFAAAAGAITFHVLLKKISKKATISIIASVIFLTIFSNKDFWHVKKYIEYSDKDLLNYTGTTTWFGENNTVWTAGEAKAPPGATVEITQGGGKISEVYRRSTLHTFSLESKNLVKIVDNTVYFPGWQVLINGKKTDIEFQDPNFRGLITFNVPQGTNKVKVEFQETKIRLASNILSLFTLFIVVLSLLNTFSWRRKPQHLI